MKLNMIKPKAKRIQLFLFNEPFPFIFALWARLAEIGVRITFIAMTFVAALVFEEIEDEIGELEEIQLELRQQHYSFASHLKRLISHYDLACRLNEKT